MTDYLNIDEIKPPVIKRIRLNGVDHDMVPPSIGSFLAEIQEAKALDKEYGNDVPLEVAISSVVRFVAAVFPTVAPADLKELSFDQLNAIRELVQIDSAPSEDVVAAEATEKAEGNA